MFYIPLYKRVLVPCPCLRCTANQMGIHGLYRGTVSRRDRQRRIMHIVIPFHAAHERLGKLVDSRVGVLLFDTSVTLKHLQSVLRRERLRVTNRF